MESFVSFVSFETLVSEWCSGFPRNTSAAVAFETAARNDRPPFRRSFRNP